MVDTCHHLFFSSLSLDNDWTLMEAKLKLIRLGILSANRQNENFDCLPVIDTYIHIEKKMMMIDAACRQSSYLLPLLTNTTNITNNKMKRNLPTNDHDDELISTSLNGIKTNQQHKKFLSPRKKLKFGVDAILGTNSDDESSFDVHAHDSDDELRHKGRYFYFHLIIQT